MNQNRPPVPITSFAFCIFIGGCSVMMGVFSRASGGETSSNVFIAFLVLGILFMVLGIGAIIVAKNLNRNSTDELIREGKFVMCDVDKVVYATELDNREPVHSTHGIFHTPVEEDYDENEEVLHPYIIYCHYTNQKGKRKDYIVPNVWVSPYPYLEKHNNQVKVYIKGDNLNRYRFDLTMFEEDV